MENASERKRGVMEMIAAMLIMGTVGYFVVESGRSPWNVVFFRCLFGAIFLAAFCYARNLFRDANLTSKTMLMAALSGVFLVANWVMLFASFKSASISTATVIYHTQPLFFVAMGVFVLREALSLDKAIWTILAFIGVVLVVDADFADFSLSSAYMAGVLLALAAALLWAITSIIVKQLKGMKPHLVALIQVGVGAVILFPFADMNAVSSASAIQWSHLITLGAVHTCLTYILMYSAFQKLNTVMIAVLSFIYPAVAIAVDYVVYDVSLGGLQFVGVFLILFGGFAVSQNLPILSRIRMRRSGSRSAEAAQDGIE